MGFDKWTLLKVFEVGFAVSCLICKRITDDEASRLFLFLQKLSREWSLLNNVTWDKLGAAIADTTYGGYIIITSALLVGRLTGEMPTARRITEIILLGIGALFYIVLGSLVFASLDSVPPTLIDNAAVLGTLSLVTGALFLLDLGGPRGAKTPPTQLQPPPKKISKPSISPENDHKVLDMEPEFAKVERKEVEAIEMQHAKRTKPLIDQNGLKNGHTINVQNGIKSVQQGYKKMKNEDTNKRFDIYGKDAVDDGAKEIIEEIRITEKHSPVWSQIRKGLYGKYDVVVPSYVYTKTDTLPLHQSSHPSSPTDPGFVQYTAQNWGQPSQKTPRHSPSQV